ncbi:hypothetical protein, partial [Xenorhabdus bovienii]|uniref:hypothetical protein n=1 Tax=Xenorhabdus bovienii TaxID=40576 RepID=UPI0023B2786C
LRCCRYCLVSAHTDCLIKLLKSGSTEAFLRVVRLRILRFPRRVSSLYFGAFLSLSSAACLRSASVSGGAL